MTGKTELIIMERDQDSPRKGYTARSYQKALSEGLLPIYDGTRRFQQDNARVHNFGGTPEWLHQHGIEYIDWPPHSPDLNPIEHMWAALKRKIRELFPHLELLQGNEESKAEFIECLKTAWAAIPDSFVRKLMQSIPQRLTAVRRARGWYTKY